MKEIYCINPNVIKLSHKLSQIYKQCRCSIPSLFVALYETRYDQHNYFFHCSPSIIDQFNLKNTLFDNSIGMMNNNFCSITLYKLLYNDLLLSYKLSQKIQTKFLLNSFFPLCFIRIQINIIKSGITDLEL